jgi:hypothetical protein
MDIRQIPERYSELDWQGKKLTNGGILDTSRGRLMENGISKMRRLIFFITCVFAVAAVAALAGPTSGKPVESAVANSNAIKMMEGA